MKLRIGILMFLLVATGLTSCVKKKIKPSNSITTETRYLSGYSGIDIDDAMNVELTLSSSEEVVVEANSNLHEYILTDVVNGILRIRMKNNICVKSGATIKIYVTAIAINEIDVSGASRLDIMNDLVTSDLKLDVSGASSMEGGIITNTADFDVSGASKVDVWGTTTEMDARISGASNVGDYGLTIDDLVIDLSGASKASFTVNGIMHITASGASTFNYKGDGLIESLNLTGASSVNKN